MRNGDGVGGGPQARGETDATAAAAVAAPAEVNERPSPDLDGGHPTILLLGSTPDQGLRRDVGDAVMLAARAVPDVVIVAAESPLVESVAAAAADVGDPLPPVLTVPPAAASEPAGVARAAADVARGARVVVLMAGEDEADERQLPFAARRGWSTLVPERPSPRAGRLGRLLGTRKRRDADSDGISRVEVGRPPELARRLAWELQDAPVLKRAWATFATYDRHAGRLRTIFERLQRAVLGLGIVATFLALFGESVDSRRLDGVLHWAVVALPIVLAAVFAISARVAAGKRWVLLRGAAEATKSEIFRARTRTGVYSDEHEEASPEEVLAQRLSALDEKLAHTEASSGAMTPYAGVLPPQMYGASADDDGLTPLDADGYLTLRVGDQLSYYHGKTAKLARLLRVFQVVIVGAGAAGTLVAAAGAEIWIGLTTAIGAGAVAYLGYLQVENTLVAYNQAASRLERLRREWEARGSRAQGDDFDQLVGDAEAVLATEHGGWTQQMTEAMEKLGAEHREAEQRLQLDRSEPGRPNHGDGRPGRATAEDDAVAPPERGRAPDAGPGTPATG